MVIKEYIGKQISEIDYLKCQYPQEQVIIGDEGRKKFKVWTLSKSSTHPENAYYYLTILTDEKNKIVAIDKMKGSQGVEQKISRFPRMEELVATMKMRSISKNPGDQKDIFSAFYGLRIDEDKLKTYCYLNGGRSQQKNYDEYYFSNSEYWNDKELLKSFGVPSNILERWQEKSIDFTVFIYVQNTILAKVEIFKAKENGDGKMGLRKSENIFPTKQEEKIAKNIIRFFLAKPINSHC